MMEKMSLLLTVLADLQVGSSDIFPITELLSTLSFRRVGSYLLVALISSTKIVPGVVAAISYNYTLLEFVLANSIGGIAGIWGYTYFGTAIRKWIARWRKGKSKPISFARRRKIYNYWHKYGLLGVSAAVLILSPPVSVGIAVAFKEKPRRILIFMSTSIVAWTFLIYGLKQAGLALFIS